MKIRDLFIEVRLRGEKALKGFKDLRKESDATTKAMGATRDATGRLRDELGRFVKDGGMASGVLGKISSGLGIAGGAMGLASNAVRALGGAIADSVKEAVAFESSMADIAKVVPSLKTVPGEFDAMKDSIFDLSKEIAIAPAGFADIIAAAGQAGVANEGFKVSVEKGREELTRFASDAAKVAVAFDLGANGAQKAGEAMAKMRTGLGLSQDEVWQLAGTFNHLGQNMAVHARELVDVTKRVGAMAKGAGLAAEQTAALGATMIASGAKTNVAATGIKNFTLALAKGEASSRSAQIGFQKIGLDAKTVAENFSKGGREAEKTMIDVLRRIKSLKPDEATAAMVQIFKSESVGAISPMLTQLDQLEKAFELAADKEAALVSVQNEYNVRSKTTANNLQLLQNHVKIAAIRIGDSLIPALNDLIGVATSPEAAAFSERILGGLREGLGKGAELAIETGKKIILIFGLLAEKLSPVFNAIGAVASGLFGGLMSGVEKAYAAMQPFIEAIGDLGSKVVEALGLGSEEGEKFGESMGSAFGDTMTAIIETFTNVIRGLVDVIGFLMPVLQPVATFLKGALVAAIDRITGMIVYLRDQFAVLGDTFRAFTSGNFAEGFAKLGRLILNSLIEPLRITARMLVDLADALPGGSNLVPGALRTFAGRTAVAGVSGMIDKVRAKAGKEGAEADAAAAEQPIEASRASMQGGNITDARRKQMNQTPAEAHSEKIAELKSRYAASDGEDRAALKEELLDAGVDPSYFGGRSRGGGGKGKKGKKGPDIAVVDDEDVLRTLHESPAETRLRIKQEIKARKDLKRERKSANALDRAVIDAAGKSSGVGVDRSGVGPSVTNIYNSFIFTIDARGNEGAAANVERAARAGASAFASGSLRGVERASMAARSGGGSAAGAG